MSNDEYAVIISSQLSLKSVGNSLYLRELCLVSFNLKMNVKFAMLTICSIYQVYEVMCM